MHVASLVPQNMIPGLAWLWRQKNWFNPRYVPAGCADFGLHVPDRNEHISRQDYEMLQKWVRGCHVAAIANLQSNAELATIYASARVVAEGPKCFFPTDEQCEAMLNVTLDIPLSYYHQPYPSFTVIFPKTFIARKAAASPTSRYPWYSMITEADEGRMLILNANYREWDGMVNVISIRQHKDSTVEELITHRNTVKGPVSEYTDCEDMQRLAMNFAMLLAGSPTHLQYRDQQTALSAQKQTIHSNPEKRREARQRLQWLVQEIKTDREVRFYTRKESKGDGTGTHASPEPHWRKGHHRREKGYREIEAAGKKARTTFIPPVLVNAKRIEGEIPAIAVDYKKEVNHFVTP